MTATAFERIYSVVAQIPKGKVSTYKDIAKRAGIQSPRVVGNALHINPTPQTIPCHRVVKSNGQLARGYAFGGIEKQKEKLVEEGVVFEKNRQIDLAKYAF